jgi:hypothetical protein
MSYHRGPVLHDFDPALMNIVKTVNERHPRTEPEEPTPGDDPAHEQPETPILVAVASLQPISDTAVSEAEPVGGGAPAIPGTGPLRTAKDVVDELLSGASTQAMMRNYYDYRTGAWE